MSKVSKILIISGSLRKHSTNSGLLRACVELKNPNLEFVWGDISDFPIFNEDVEQKGLPESVQRVRKQVAESQGLLFGVAEYNLTISSPLKNAFDWLSRGETPLMFKPTGIISSAGSKGGELAQKTFLTMAEFPKMKVMNNPFYGVKRFTGNFFDEKGNLID